MEWQIDSARHEWKHGVSSVVRNSELFEIGVVRKSALFENQLSSDQLFDHRFPRHAEMKEQ
jgi:hypothetical protein